MRLRMLMIGNDEAYLATDRDFLKEKGIHVYSSLATKHLNELISEINPDIIFLNYRQPGTQEMELYHNVLDNLRIIRTPVIFTLSEDAAYLVSRDRTASHNHRNHISDNIGDAVKQAFSDAGTSRKIVPQFRKTVFLHTSLPASA